MFALTHNHIGNESYPKTHSCFLNSYYFASVQFQHQPTWIHAPSSGCSTIMTSEPLTGSINDDGGGVESLDVSLLSVADTDDEVLGFTRKPSQRSYGTIAGYAIVVNCIIGTGVFGLPYSFW